MNSHDGETVGPQPVSTLIEDARLLTGRQCDIGKGTKVINCVLHIGRRLTDRPTDCALCCQDVQNRLREAIAVNEWLNHWKDDAEKILSRCVEALLST